MINLSEYEELLVAVRELIKAEKYRDKCNKKIFNSDWNNTTRKRRANMYDNLTRSCEDLDRCKSILHARLVDCELLDPLPLDEYSVATTSTQAGLGHSISRRIHPEIPKCIKEKIGVK